MATRFIAERSPRGARPSARPRVLGCEVLKACTTEGLLMRVGTRSSLFAMIDG